MTRAGDEMILELAGLLKTAAKDEDKPKDEAKPKKDDEKKGKDKPKKCKKCKKEDCACGPMHDKKAAITGILRDLVKMANTLDEAGAEEAAGLVDEVIQVILKDKKAMDFGSEEAMLDDEMADVVLDEDFEDEPAPVDVGVPSEEDMPEMGSHGDDPRSGLDITPEIAKLLVDMGWEPPQGQKV